MNKKIIFLIALMLVVNSVCAFAADNSKRAKYVEQKMKEQEQQQSSASELDKDTVYYPDANIKSAVSKYKAGNYSGCLQELFSLTKKDPNNAAAYYYMAMAYTHIDMQAEAIEAYEKVMELKPNSYIADFAEKGRDCLTDGPKCSASDDTEEQSELDKFINAPYGNGLSQELNDEVKQKQLKNIKETINKKDELENKDIEKIREFDLKHNKKLNDDTTFITMPERIAMVSDEEILQAVKTLKDAGLNVTVQQNSSYNQYSQYQDPRMAEMSALLGNNNNNNNMMNMLPMLMNKAENGESIDPRFMQAMMMNSMMSDLDFNGNNNNKY